MKSLMSLVLMFLMSLALAGCASHKLDPPLSCPNCGVPQTMLTCPDCGICP